MALVVSNMKRKLQSQIIPQEIVLQKKRKLYGVKNMIYILNRIPGMNKTKQIDVVRKQYADYGITMLLNY